MSEREGRHAGGHLHRDRHRVVDDERRAGDDAGARAEKARGDEVAAAARREELDDLRVRRRDDDDRQRRGDREEDGEVPVRPEGDEELLRAVARGREAVRSEAHPGEEGDERELVKDVGIERVAALPEEDPLRQLLQGHDAREYTRARFGLRALQ